MDIVLILRLIRKIAIHMLYKFSNCAIAENVNMN